MAGSVSVEAPLDAAGLLRSVGLLADGPAVWGRPIRAPGAGIFIVELPSPPASAPIDINKVGKWLEHVPTIRIDGKEPTSKEIASRLGAFWIPSTSVLYIGTSEQSVAARVSAIERTILGDRRPYPGGGWLKTLHGLDRARVWWATTAATEEYEDALISAFAAAISDADRARLHDPKVVLPFANLRSVGGEKKAHGLTGYLVPDDRPAPGPAGSVRDLPAGDAEGASGLPTRTAGGTLRRGSTAARKTPVRAAPRERTSVAAPRGRRAVPPGPPRGEPVFLSADGMARLHEELAELTGTKRPEVIQRIKSAKELGDLKENADYTSAREEQSFLEGRIKTIEALLRDASVIEAPSSEAGGKIGLGSKVSIADPATPQDVTIYELVGPPEADPSAGRISNMSPVGKALVGKKAGETVLVRTPRGDAEFVIVAVD
ncbi:MAG: transcription elongation factor GreA [Solirubrobacterales bacterium]|jgi:transcription elongation factor GreA|nr:transcription elongation factor GreA [Solirubrobacterales bacterium]